MLSTVLLLAGCGGDDPADNSPAAAKSAVSSKAAAQVAEITKGMVGAVTSEKPGAAVDLKFDVKSRPEVGQPLKIEVAMVPQQAGTLMRITYISGQGLTVQPSPAPTEYHNVLVASVYKHEVTVTPQENGVFYLSAIVQLESGGEAQVRTFSIPIVVGSLPESAQKAGPPAPVDATGQSVQSMPASQ